MGKQPTTGQKKSKDAIAKAASSAKGGRKKWTKGKVKDKLALAVFYDEETYKKLLEDIPKLRLITPAIVTDKLKVNQSLARRGIRHLREKNLIRVLDAHRSMWISTGVKAKAIGEKEEGAEEGTKPQTVSYTHLTLPTIYSV
eukprot:TRINITY_DN1056_c0_g2_i5.p1 TRINITY_DN1056_c0_g2~~TRINITY_DN1056_c0_g2_i5.p1  ORF type:complete len:142 (+),score=48.24 TRINITY_DN1056_c0_g2_i5:65-490(+)